MVIQMAKNLFITPLFFLLLSSLMFAYRKAGEIMFIYVHPSVCMSVCPSVCTLTLEHIRRPVIGGPFPAFRSFFFCLFRFSAAFLTLFHSYFCLQAGFCGILGEETVKYSGTRINLVKSAFISENIRK